LAAVVGIAGVVTVFLAVLSIAQGILRTMEMSVGLDNAIVLRSGSDTEMMSGLTGDEARLISEAPGIVQGPNGPQASSELFVIINLPKRSTGTDANVPLRGVVPAAVEIRDRFVVTQGRFFEWGLAEVVVGIGASREFAGLKLGDEIEVGRDRWPVVGIFEAEGGIAESEIWCDASVLQSAYRRGNSYQSVYARLESAGSFSDFKDSLTSDPRLNVKVLREADYYASQTTILYGLITGLGTLIAGLMGLGAIFGALNTMYSAVAGRTREIATLRAIGFRASPVIGAVIFESLVLAAAGGLIGGSLAYFVFDGFRASTINYASFAQIAFTFDVSPGLLAQGIVYALLIGLIGGLFPAIRAARTPIATALREQ
jgi:putative ABC transport system permease protein